MMRKYDVVLSFAGEDRDYVVKIADSLKRRGVKVFYDKYETGTLWGKDLYQHLNDIYKNKGEYCIVFISDFYKEKLWTRHELKSAQSRAFVENEEYILPILLGNTTLDEIPGLNGTLGYIKAENFTSNEIVGYIEDKLAKEVNHFINCKDVKDLFEVAIKEISAISRTDYNQIVLYTKTGEYSYGLLVVADAISNFKQHYRITVMNGLIHKCYKEGKIFNIGDVENYPDYFKAVYETGAELLVPIKIYEKTIGVINIESEQKDYFTNDMIEKIEWIAKHFGRMLSKLEFDNEDYEGIPYVSL